MIVMISEIRTKRKSKAEAKLNILAFKTALLQ